MIQDKDINRIDKNALQLLETVFGDVKSLDLPIDLNKIVKHCGLTIKQGDFTTDPTTEGILDRNARTIFLSKNDSVDRKNFTLAHEIGHYKLHEDETVDVFRMHDLDDLLHREDDDTKEDEADLFAASLLMPKQLVQSFWETTKDAKILSNIFGVPENAVIFRLRSLKLMN